VALSAVCNKETFDIKSMNQHTLLTHTEFISKIIDDADTGASFVPFIGSGMSSASGIIMGTEFTNYLTFCMYIILESPDNRPRTQGEGKKERWDLKKQGWPILPNANEIRLAREWVESQLKKICNRLDLEINWRDDKVKSIDTKPGKAAIADLKSVLIYPQIPAILRHADASRYDDYSRKFIEMQLRDRETGLFLGRPSIEEIVPDPRRSYHEQSIEAGIRALHDWRETLEFLSMIKVDPNNSERVIRVKRDEEIIDLFNQTITRDKQPNLAHKLLAHLSGPLRIQTILTTNFDKLIEEAYHKLEMRITVLPVVARGSLPGASTVAADDCLVKMHGEGQYTRADLSLDEEPSDEDKQTFCEYLTLGSGGVGPRFLKFSNVKQVSKRLLVIGYSGSDHRCVQMIRHWLESAPDAVVYWICFSQYDVQKVQEIFQDAIYSDKLRITQFAQPDLLLFELFQNLSLSLPPGGISFEFVHPVPPRGNRDFDFDLPRVETALSCGLSIKNPVEAARILVGYSGDFDDVFRLYTDAMVLHLDQCILDAVDGKFDDKEYFKDCYVHIVQWTRKEGTSNPLAKKPILIDANVGFVRASAIAFQKISSQGKKVFWFSLQDVMDSDSLLRNFLRSLAIKCGMFQTRIVRLYPFNKPLSTKIKEANNDFGKVAIEIARFVTALLDQWRVDAASVVLMLYGRDGYGGNSALVPTTWKDGNDKGKFGPLHCVIEALAIVGIRIVYFPLQDTRSKSKTDNHVDLFGLLKEQDQAGNHTSRDFDGLSAASLWKYDDLANKLFSRKSSTLTSQSENAIGKNWKLQAAYSPIRSLIYSILPHDLGDRILRERETNETVDVDKDTFNHLHFLYSMTLFRHSRNPSAIFSDATFPSPFRNNHHAIDNDLVREQITRGWVHRLRKKRVLLDKPGGALWMHRDIQFAIRGCLEKVRFAVSDNIVDSEQHHELTLDVNTTTEPTSNQRLPIDFKTERYAIHRWISDWYFKAFCSSGHIFPVIESLYHGIMSAKFSLESRGPRTSKQLTPKELKNYQFNNFNASLLQVEKLVKLSMPWIMPWQSSTVTPSWLTKTKLQLKTYLDFTSLASESQTRVNSIVRVLDILGKELVSEGSGTDHAYWFDGFSQKEEAKGPESDDLEKSMHDETNFKDHCDKIFGKSKATELKDVYVEVKKLAFQHLPSNFVNFSRAKGKFKTTTLSSLKSVHSDVQIMARLAYLHFQRAKVICHAEDTLDLKEWAIAAGCCEVGFDLCRYITPESLELELDLKLDFLAIYSVCQGSMGRFFEADRYLNEAQALISKKTDSPLTNYAKLNLRRAELRLLECSWMAACNQLVPNDIGKYNAKISALGKSETRLFDLDRVLRTTWTVTQVRSLFPQDNLSSLAIPYRVAEVFRKENYNLEMSRAPEAENEIYPLLKAIFMATLDEAAALLDQSERQLSGSSQSALWWSRLYSLRLKSLGMLRFVDNTSASRSLLLRKSSPDVVTFNCISALLVQHRDDSFRQLRSIEYFYEAKQWLCKFFHNDDPVPDSRKRVSEVLKVIEGNIHSSPSMLKKFYHKFENRS